MKHIVIPQEKEPDCLKVLRSNPEHTYDDLKDECRDEVVKQLCSLQDELCAYCERKFSSPEDPNIPHIAIVPHIEHYLPQSPSNFPQFQLNWNNFLAVCSGYWYLDRMKGTKHIFCNKRRENTLLNLDPRELTHIETIYFDSTHKIRSQIPEFENELNSVFNLNFDEICRDRADRYMEFDSIFMDEGERMNLSLEEIILRAIDTVENENPAYKSFILYRYREQLRHSK